MSQSRLEQIEARVSTGTLKQLRSELTFLRRPIAWSPGFAAHAEALAARIRERLERETPEGEDWELGPQYDSARDAGWRL